MKKRETALSGENRIGERVKLPGSADLTGMVNLPGPVGHLIARLEEKGFAAWVVGGCVRDSLLGRRPGDWDVASDAFPQEVIDCFAEHRVIETGMAHGTVTVALEGMPIEVTTFRVDGAYRDHRHPDGVRFVSVLEEDLARRDFTVNAMAYHPQRGLVDPFGGGKICAEESSAAWDGPSSAFGRMPCG